MVSVDASKGIRPFYRSTKQRPKVREIEAADKLGDPLEGEHGGATKDQDGEKKRSRPGAAIVGRKLDISL